MKGMDEDFYFFFPKESKKVKDEYLTLPYLTLRIADEYSGLGM